MSAVLCPATGCSRRVIARWDGGSWCAEPPVVPPLSILAGSLANLSVGGGDFDEIFDADVEDVAQCGQGVQAQTLRRRGDQAEDLFAGKVNAALGEQRNQVSGGEHVAGGHELAQVPLVAHLLDHWPSHSSGCRPRARRSSRLRYSSETPV